MLSCSADALVKKVKYYLSLTVWMEFVPLNISSLVLVDKPFLD